jgi:hypothetical protein
MTIAMLLNNTLASCERTVHDKSHDQSLFAMHRIA